MCWLSGDIARRALSFGVALPISATLTTVVSPRPAVAATTDPAAGLAVEPCPVGAELELPVASQLTPDGWIVMAYDLGGMTAYRELPPIGFDA